MKNFGLLVLWGIALVQSANALFFCLRNNPCWGALGVVGGLLDCLGNLVVTVTPPVVTQTKTVTAVVSAVDTVTVTTSTTATVATTTALFTESTTTTASTATNTVLQTTTIFTTSTNVQTASAITTSTTVYGAPPTQRMARDNVVARDSEVLARGNNPWGIPDYAWPACQDWDHYVDACKCFGIHPITVTKAPTTTTVTVTASNAVTTTVSTLTTTTTNTVPVTATTSATFTAVIEVIASTSITQVVTTASTIVVTTTTTPTITSTTFCKATGVPFRVAVAPGSDVHLRLLIGVFTSWEEDSNPNLQDSTFVLDNNGFIELATPLTPGAPDQVLEIDVVVRGSVPSEDIYGQPQDVVESDPSRYVRIKGCIDPVTDVLSLSADGRNNILNCDGNAYLSSTDGSDLGSNCVTVTPVAE